jgi:hypothetical protein
MLGTNDFQFCHAFNNAWSAAQGIAALVREIRNAPLERSLPVPPVLVVCPPLICSPRVPSHRSSLQPRKDAPVCQKPTRRSPVSWGALSSMRDRRPAAVESMECTLTATEHATLGKALAELVSSELSGRAFPAFLNEGTTPEPR